MTGFAQFDAALFRLSTAAAGPVGALALTAVTSHYQSDTGASSRSMYILFPTNPVAALLDGSTNKPYVSSVAASSGFTVKGASTAAFAGTETYNYLRLG